MPLTPPPGWSTLQEKARRATDPTELASIIDEMNRVLAACEKAAAGNIEKSRPSKQNRGKMPGIGEKGRD
jgi:hypothetical protein